MSVTLLSDATPGASVKRLTSNVALAASTTVALTELNVAVNAGDVVSLDYCVNVTTTAGVAGLQPVFTLPAGASGSMVALGSGAAVGTLTMGAVTTALTTAFATPFLTAVLTGGTLLIRALIVCPNAGTIGLGLATGLLAAGSVLAASHVNVQKV